MKRFQSVSQLSWSSLVLATFLGLTGLVASYGFSLINPSLSPVSKRNPTGLPTQRTKSAIDSIYKPSVLLIRVFSKTIEHPLPSAVVLISSQVNNRLDQFTTTTNGRLERSFLKPDQLTVEISAPGYKSVSKQLNIVVTSFGKVYELDAVLDQVYYSVSIQAVNARTEQAIPGIYYTVTGPAGMEPLVLRPDPATGLAVTTLPATGVYQITSTAPGYDDFAKAWVVEKERSDVLFRLVPRKSPSETNPKATTVSAAPTSVATAPKVTTPIATTLAATTAIGATSVAVKPVLVPDKPRVTTPGAVTAVVTSVGATSIGAIKPVPSTVLTPPVKPSFPSTEVVLKPSSTVADARPPVATKAGSATLANPCGKVEKGKRIQLNNIYFDQSNPVLRPESYTELDQLYALLAKNPALRIEIRGYTDNQGDFDLNVQLSRDRCLAVLNYLVGKGIARSRLKAVGRGPLDPVAPNTSEENRRKNRRVEFEVL